MSLLSESEDFALRLAKFLAKDPVVYCNGCGEMERDWNIPDPYKTPRYEKFKVYVKYGHPPVYLCDSCNKKYEEYKDIEKHYREYLQSVKSLIGLFQTLE